MVDPIPVGHAEFEPQQRTRRQLQDDRSPTSRRSPRPPVEHQQPGDQPVTPPHSTSDAGVGGQIDLEV